jgi:hypothetical protein
LNLGRFERFSDAAEEAGVVFYFSGEFTSSGVGALGGSLRRRLEERGVPRPIGKKLFATFVELAQNVLHYAAAEPGGPPGPSRGTITLGSGEAGHWIAASNQIRVEQVPRLAERLESLRQMTPDQLRAAYRLQLDSEEHEALDPISRGAGLGLITIARACTSFEYGFLPVTGADGSLSCFYLRARLAVAPQETP